MSLWTIGSSSLSGSGCFCRLVSLTMAQVMRKARDEPHEHFISGEDLVEQGRLLEVEIEHLKHTKSVGEVMVGNVVVHNQAVLDKVEEHIVGDLQTNLDFL